jgi:V8-like Glu-specific endopeptidase
MVKGHERRFYKNVFPHQDLVDLFHVRQVNPQEIDPQFATDCSFAAESTEVSTDREVIHGDDQRKLVARTELDPFRYVCQVIGTRSGQTRKKAGTGFVIDPQTVLTAAHNLWLGECNTCESNRVDTLVVYPGLNGNRSSYETLACEVNRSVAHPNYVSSRDSRFDFALLHLYQPLPIGFGKLPIIAVNPSDLRNHLAMITGYPFKEPRSSTAPAMPQCNQYYDVGVLVPHGGLIKYFADTTEGQSGSPVIVITKDQDEREIWTGVAVHIEGSASTGNKAAPITPCIYDFIRANS